MSQWDGNDPLLSRTERFFVNVLGWILCAAAALAAAALLGWQLIGSQRRQGRTTITAPASMAGIRASAARPAHRVATARLSMPFTSPTSIGNPVTVATGFGSMANGSTFRLVPCWTARTATGGRWSGLAGLTGNGRCGASCRGR